jgi:hypothetical protein
MSWRKYFKEYGTEAGTKSPVGSTSPQQPGTQHSKYNTWLPEVYAGMPNRRERYYQYDMMDLDTEINAAIDTIAEFCSQIDEETGSPFNIKYKEEPTDTESSLLVKTLHQWNKINQWQKRCFKMVRNTIKYGDQMFVRDPQTYKWYWVDPTTVERIVVNEGKGKKPEAYFIKNLDLNVKNLNITSDAYANFNSPLSGGNQAMGSPMAGGMSNRAYQPTGQSPAGGYGGTRFQRDATVYPIDASHIVHLSLTEGMDRYWPFGVSLLEPIFKTFKQKELLEDSIIIYRVQRAPERRVFYIDVGNMPTSKAMGFIERVKNEIHQRRIPNQTGGGSNVMDATYNPLSMIEDYFFAQTAEGRGSKVETLPGGTQLGEIDDLRYFNDKLMKGLRVPSAYLPSSPNDPQTAFTDGRVGTAYIQEFRFTKFCKRIQNFIQPNIDKEFKMFLKHRGIEIDSGMFEIQFNEPQNFGKYRQIELDTQLVNIFNQVQQVPYISKRFAMKRFMKMTEDEIYENQRLWAEENASSMPGEEVVGDDLGAVGGAPMPASTMPASDTNVNPDLDGTQSPISGDTQTDTDTEPTT